MSDQPARPTPFRPQAPPQAQVPTQEQLELQFLSNQIGGLSMQLAKTMAELVSTRESLGKRNAELEVQNSKLIEELKGLRAKEAVDAISKVATSVSRTEDGHQ